MFIIVFGVLSLVWCIHSMTGRNIPEGGHRPHGVRPPRQKTDVPGLGYMIWLFLSIVAILGGYVYESIN